MTSRAGVQATGEGTPARAGPRARLRGTRQGALLGTWPGILPGALAGAHLALLLFFLNPAVPFAPGPVLRAMALYGGLLAGAGLLAVLPWTWGRPRQARRLLPWTLAAALALAAALDGAHASYYAYYLPAGINDRLLKVALWVGLAALAAFYTALLHTVSRRPYGRRSRWGLTALALLSLFAAMERRQAYRPRPEPSARPAVTASGAPRLLVVALEGATLDAILPLAGEGRLPFFATLLQDGSYGRLSSLGPHRPAALWTTLATGRYPYGHGVTGEAIHRADFLAPGAQLHLLPAGIAFRHWGLGLLGAESSGAATGARRASALWELLPRLGVPAGLVGWPASAPAPREGAFALTDRFFARGGADLSPATAFPTELALRARLFRVSGPEIDPTLLARFGPAVERGLEGALAADLWRQSLARYLLDPNLVAPATAPPPAFLLALPGLEGISRRAFGGFSVVEFEGAKARVYREAAQLVTAYYELLDEHLAELWSRQQQPAILAVVSAYGVAGPGHWRQLWGEISREAAVSGDTSGSPDGVLLLYGAGIRPGSLVAGAKLVDVVPTLLYGLGFPVPRDLDGKVLTAAFDKKILDRRPLTFVSTYEPPRGQ